MSQRMNIEAQRKLSDAVSCGKLGMLKELIDPGIVDHDPAPGQGPGAEGMLHSFSQLRGAFPDLKLEVKHTVADEHCVATAYKMTGTHKGNFHGIPATGHTIIARGMEIARFNGGRMVERWGVVDELGILEQLGVAPGRNRFMS